jgi:hypothetical protein
LNKQIKTIKTPVPLPPKPSKIPIQKPLSLPPKLDMTIDEQKKDLYKKLENNDNFPPELHIKNNIGKNLV